MRLYIIFILLIVILLIILFFIIVYLMIEIIYGVYFGDLKIYYGVVVWNLSEFGVLRYNGSVIAVYSFFEGAWKNRFFIPNQLGNEYGPMEVLTGGVDYPFFPFLQDRVNFFVSTFQKFFKFKVDDNSIFNNNYIISCKFNVQKIIGYSYKFLIYGRSNKNFDIFSGDSDIVELNIEFRDADNLVFGFIEFGIILKVNNVIIDSD